MLLTLALSVLIGLLLGVLGGGGSILTVPMLVYLLHVEPKTAIVTSFVVVGVSSLMALIAHARRGSVCWKSGVFFGLSGMIGAFSGGRLGAHLSSELLMLLFGGVTLLTGVLMVSRGTRAPVQAVPAQRASICPLRVPFMRVLFDGFFVGALTGMVGVGGGFLIVPALTLLVGLPMQGAVGTSLLVIVMNAVAGLGGYSQHVALDLPLTAVVAVGAISGSALGSILSGYIKPSLLRRVFGFMVMLVAVYVLYQAATAPLLADIKEWLLNPFDLTRVLAGFLILLVLVWIGSRIHKTESVIFTSNNPPKER